jgi:hypothetical protein
MATATIVLTIVDGKIDRVESYDKEKPFEKGTQEELDALYRTAGIKEIGTILQTNSDCFYWVRSGGKLEKRRC